MEFKDPLYLLLFIPLAAWAVVLMFLRSRRGGISARFSSTRLLKANSGVLAVTYPFLPLLRFAALSFLIIALARPGRGVTHTEVINYGVDIMIALDDSPSMMGLDFEPDRLGAAKNIVKEFAAKRPHDRIGMVIFSGEAYLQAPLTADKSIIGDITDDIDFDSVNRDGTAIGEAIALSAARLKDSKAASRIILLITDGVNNMGMIDPQTAAQAARDLGIKIYCIGIGKDGEVEYPSGNPLFPNRRSMNQFDEKGLVKIADISGGKFFRASEQGSFEKSMQTIDSLEKSDYNIKQYYEFSDKFYLYLVLAGVFFVVEVILRSAVYRKLP